MFTYCFITNVKTCNRHCLYQAKVVLFPDSKYGFYRSILVLMLQILDLRGMLLLKYFISLLYVIFQFGDQLFCSSDNRSYGYMYAYSWINIPSIYSVMWKY